MKVVSFIPIKFESQRLPGKTLRPLGGKPLCRHLFDTMSAVRGVEEKYVYCSDGKIQNYMPDNLRLLKRESWLDGDDVKCFDFIKCFIKDVAADIYILAHITSPFIKKETIERALEQVVSGAHDSAFSAQRIQSFVWYKGIPLNYDINDVPRTQTLEPIFVETSAFFIFRKEVFTKLSRRIGLNPYICETDPVESIDIDTQDDYDLAQKIHGS